MKHRNNKNMLIADQVQHKPVTGLLELHYFKVYPKHHPTSSMHNSKLCNKYVRSVLPH